MRAAIVIISCDAFSDCWDPIFFSFEKFWPDCPYPIYLVNNFSKINNNKVNVINVGEDKGFASNLKSALSTLNYDYVFYFQDDYFLSQKVNTQFIVDHLSYCINNDVDFLKIHKNDYMIRDKFQIADTDYCINPLDMRYSVNTSIAIWKKKTLELCCIDGYSGWEWERATISIIKNLNISFNSQILHSSVMITKGITTLPGGAVAKGKWTLSGKDFLLKYGFENLLPKRKIEGVIIANLTKLYNRYPKSILKYPIALVVRILLKYRINI